MIEITLDIEQCWAAAWSGVLRHLLNLRRPKLPDRTGRRWDDDIEGSGAELAVGVMRDLAWTPVAIGAANRHPYRTLNGDVASLEVRSTTRSDGRLLLHPSDPDEAVFVFVTGQMPHYSVHGWIRGAEGKREQFWRSDRGMPRPCYAVPPTILHPISPADPRKVGDPPR